MSGYKPAKTFRNEKYYMNIHEKYYMNKHEIKLCNDVPPEKNPVKKIPIDML